MDKKNNFLKLFANCIIVKGHTRSLLCDLQKGKSYYVPNGLHEFTTWLDKLSVYAIKEKYDSESCTIIDEYIDFLTSNQFAFWCSREELDLFPSLSLEWDYPGHISNAIIDVNKRSDLSFFEIFRQLEELGCKDIQIRVYDAFSIPDIRQILLAIENRTAKSIELFVKHDLETGLDSYFDLIHSFPRVTAFYLHSSEADEILFHTTTPPLLVAKIKQPLNFKSHCGVIDERYFAVTTELFTESQHHNTCLNRKLSIDVNGNIKNCPSQRENYGNIANTSLKEVLSMPEFKKYWGITKDQISVCKDCEFRHICTDCRVFREDPHDLYSKPLKCGYDPYTATWSDWSTNPLKTKAIEYYTLYSGSQTT